LSYDPSIKTTTEFQQNIQQSLTNTEYWHTQTSCLTNDHSPQVLINNRKLTTTTLYKTTNRVELDTLKSS